MENSIVILRVGKNAQTNSNQSVATSYFKALQEKADNGERFADGTLKAYQAWYYSACQGEIVWDNLWEKEVHDFVATMREAGVKSIIYTEKSTALMGNLHAFVSEGCEISGLVRIEKGEGIWASKTQGIRIRI